MFSPELTSLRLDNSYILVHSRRSEVVLWSSEIAVNRWRHAAAIGGVVFHATSQLRPNSVARCCSREKEKEEPPTEGFQSSSASKCQASRLISLVDFEQISESSPHEESFTFSERSNAEMLALIAEDGEKSHQGLLWFFCDRWCERELRLYYING